jgi:TRAP-type C4-dicarboxylate transport system permease small subunit
MLAVSAFMVVYGTRLCMGTWGQSIPELTWLPVGLTYTPLPVGGFVTALFVLEHMVYGDQGNRAVVTYDWTPQEPAHAEGTL